MLNNRKTTDLVKEALENDLYLLELLKEDLVNYSALARRILPAIKKENPKASIESVSVAMRRYVAGEKKKRLSNAVRRIIADSQLSTRNDLVHMTFRREEPVLARIVEVSKKINWVANEIFFFNQGAGEITIIMDEKNAGSFKSCARHRIEELKDLCVISIKENMDAEGEKSIDVPGVYAYFINQLSRHSINIIEIVSTYSQENIIIRAADLLRAYSVLEESIRYFRKAKDVR